LIKFSRLFIYLLTFAGFFREHWQREYRIFLSSVILPLINSVVVYSVNSRIKNAFFLPSEVVKLCFAYDTAASFAIWSSRDETIF